MYIIYEIEFQHKINQYVNQQTSRVNSDKFFPNPTLLIYVQHKLDNR